jgi:hypothetical protein
MSKYNLVVVDTANNIGTLSGAAFTLGVLQSAGAQGLSAYQAALANGFVGSEAAWLATLVGPTGSTGAVGPTGTSGVNGGGTDEVFIETDTVVTTNYTITTNKNALTAGPVTINPGVVITIPSGSVWTVV